MTQAIQKDDTRSVLYLAFELSARHWKLGFSNGGSRLSERSINAWDWSGLDQAMARAKQRFGLAPDCRVVSCYEAGRDGFWLHRQLSARGVENVVVDPASIDVDRRARRTKTDRIDLRMLNRNLVRHWGGEADGWSVLRIPTEADEDARRDHRELERLKKERGAHRVRMQELLLLHGIRTTIKMTFSDDLQHIRRSDGTKLPPGIEAELRREAARLAVVHEQIAEISKERQKALVANKNTSNQKVLDLMALRGVGSTGAWILVYEVFAWRVFQNRRQLAASVGLTPTPFQSGSSNREQGISKAGNRRVRSLMVELAWSWLRYQPHSALSKWFQTKFGHGKGRGKRVGIVALARRLLIALWRYLEQGVVPEGIIVKTEAQLTASIKRAA